MNAETIRVLQHDLRLLTMMNDQYKMPDTDGVYGAKTADAVRAFQLVNGLPVTGETDVITLQKIADEYEDVMALIAQPMSICPFPSPYEVLSSDCNGPLVYILQAMLCELAVGVKTPICPVVSGTYDAQTVNCIEQWQQIFGLPINGTVDRYCWDMLATVYNMRLL